MTKKKLVSPLATGGIGTIFEYRVAAVMLSHLLRSSHAPGLQAPVVEVGLQQGVRGNLLDDIVVRGGPGHLRTQFQVKRTLTVTKSDDEFVDVVAQALHALSTEPVAVASGDLALGLIAEGEEAPLRQLEQLTRWAHAHTGAGSFFDYMQDGVVAKVYRDRLTRVQEAIEVAITRGAPSLGTIQETTHQLLGSLHIWRPTLSDDGETFLAVLDSLKPFADAWSTTPASVFAHLAAIAESSGPFGGVADKAHVLRRLRRRGLYEAPSAPQLEVGEINVDAVVRGPVEALGLRPELEAAEASLGRGEPDAIRAFERLAIKLQDAHFVPDAIVMLRLRADALQAAGRVDEAALARVEIAWNDLDRVRVWEAGFALSDGRRHGAEPVINDISKRVQAMADAAVDVAKGDPPIELAAPFDQLQESDPYRARTAVSLCEEAIAAAQPSLIRERLATLRSIANRALADTDERTRLFAVRIMMCLADATGEWTAFMRNAVRTQPRHVTAWLHARYARHLALNGDGPGAQEHYLEAIERATAEKMFDDAADWLYALRTTVFLYELDDRHDQHPTAQAMRPHAKPSNLPGATHTAELALSAMLDDDKPREALQRMERWRWQCVVRAQLTDEFNTCKRLGMLLQRVDRLDAAVENYIRAGEAKEAFAAAELANNTLGVLVPTSLAPVSTIREAAFRAAAANADFFSEELLRSWADEALADIAEPIPEHGSTSVASHQAALEFLAAAVDSLTMDQNHDLGRIVQSAIERPLGRHLGAEDALATILSGLADRDAAFVPLLCSSILGENRIAERIYNRLPSAGKHDKQIVETLLPYAGTSEMACKTIIVLGDDATTTVEFAKAKVSAEIAVREHRAGQHKFPNDAPTVAILARALDSPTRSHFASVLLDRALDRREVKANRYNDLCGLFNISTGLDKPTKQQLIPRVLEIASGKHEDGPTFFDHDPLLSPIALRCAALLEPTDDQSATIQQLGLAGLLGADEGTQWKIGKAFASLPQERLLLDLSYLAVHPSPAMRALAGIRWTRNSALLPPERAHALATDTDFRVRRELARALTADWKEAKDARHDIGEILSSDLRRSIRTLANRPRDAISLPR